ncbi:MAG TPA: RluA family pseudouridine synthase [bacterium]|nr:RluA family pseudouridine synthase [bacterium]
MVPTADLPPRVHAAFEAAAGDRGRRLDVTIAGRLPQYSRSRATHLAGRGQVLVDREPRKPAFRLRPGQRVQVLAPAADPLLVGPEAIPLAVVHEDADVLVIDKPAGLTVHPAPGHPGGTLVNAVLARVPAISGIGGALRPGIVHRLDKDTSGLLVVAKTDTAYRSLTAQLRARSMGRVYLALVRGTVAADSGVIAAPVGRHPTHRTRMAVVPHGRPAVTAYRVRERLPGATLLECRLETGRTHQIRVHLLHVGHPILGDPVYGSAGVPGLERQALHAARLEFLHPRTGSRLVFDAPLPGDIDALLDRLRREAAGPAPRGEQGRPHPAAGRARKKAKSRARMGGAPGRPHR